MGTTVSSEHNHSPKRLRNAAIAASLLAAISIAPAAHAQATQNTTDNTTLSPVESPSGWMNGKGITGNWGGERAKLADEGFTFFGNFEVQTADIVKGGKAQGVGTNHQVELGTNVDLQKLWGVPGGNFTLAVSERFGTNASNLAGTRVIINSNYGEGENFRLANMSFRQNFLDGRLSYQIGYFPAAAEFDYSPILCALLNQGFCGHPNSLGADSSGFQNPPGAQLGGRVTGFILPDVYLKFGVFDVQPSHYVNNAPGFDIGTGGSTGVIYLSELGWNAKLGPQGLPGHYKLGGYYDTSSAPDVVNAKLQRDGRSNGWISADQMVYGFNPDSSRGLVLFANVTDADRTNALMESYYSAGVIVLGPFASRPNDILSLAWARSNLNDRVFRAESEQKPNIRFYPAEKYLELSYRVQLTPWLFITPDVQYLMDPGAYSRAHYPNATVVGGELAIQF
jgi:porin